MSAPLLPSGAAYVREGSFQGADPEGLSEEVSLGSNLCDKKEPARQTWRKVPRAEGTASAKALRPGTPVTLSMRHVRIPRR
jgi:hypothetical protein